MSFARWSKVTEMKCILENISTIKLMHCKKNKRKLLFHDISFLNFKKERHSIWNLICIVWINHTWTFIFITRYVLNSIRSITWNSIGIRLRAITNPSTELCTTVAGNCALKKLAPWTPTTIYYKTIHLIV